MAASARRCDGEGSEAVISDGAGGRVIGGATLGRAVLGGDAAAGGGAAGGGETAALSAWIAPARSATMIGDSALRDMLNSPRYFYILYGRREGVIALKLPCGLASGAQPDIGAINNPISRVAP